MNRILIPFIIFIFSVFCFNTKSVAQTCQDITEWQTNEIITYSEGAWGGDINSASATLLANNFSSVYVSGLVAGGTNTITFTYFSALYSFFNAQTGPANALNMSVVNPDETSAGVFAAEVIALKLNVDFSDAGLLGNGDIKFGDLFICGTGEPGLDGLTVRQFLEIANDILGADPTPLFSVGTASAVTSLLTSAFAGGTPSQFAQDHLSVCPCTPPPCEDITEWQTNEIITYDQNEWSTNAVLWSSMFTNVYPDVFIVGGENQIIFTMVSRLIDFIGTQTGAVGVLNESVMNPDDSPGGTFAADVMALQMNVDFSDAAIILSGSSQTLFGDLYICGTPMAALNGLTIRQFLDTANHILGGSYNSQFTPAQAASILGLLNTTFTNGTPSQFALDYLSVCPCSCPPIESLETNAINSYDQNSWGSFSTDAGTLLANNFTNVYPEGLYVGAGEAYEILFTMVGRLINFLGSQVGAAGILSFSSLNPDNTPAGVFASDVIALKLNVDFSDAGLIGSGDIKFGDLYICGTNIEGLDGMTVRQFLDSANMILGAASFPFGLGTASTVAGFLNTAFTNGTPSQFALDHLSVCPCDEVNHCPVASSASVTTTVGTAINIQLQASDEDNDALTYSISQNPLHGTVTTSASGAAIYTPTAGYYGADQFKFKADDGECDNEATVTITIVVCPRSNGYWKNHQSAWPSSATPMLLGSVSYTRSQLVNILNKPVGTGNKADASITLAYQLIAARLNIANGTIASQQVLDSITAAHALIGNNLIPMKVKPNTPLGQRMVKNADFLETYNNGLFTVACQTSTAPLIATKQQAASNELIFNRQQNSSPGISTQAIDKLEVNAYPNPASSYFNILINSNDAKEKTALQVFDQYGRVIETRNNISNGSTVRLGEQYRSGVYYVRVIQGKQHKEIKLIKLSIGD